MTLKCISSGSKGNCYLLTSSEGSTLVLECGLPIKEIKQALGFSYKGVAGCVVTHQHKDHAKSVKDIMHLGIPVLAIEDVFKAKGLGYFCMIAKHKKAYKMGEYKISAYNAFHDVPCLCYVIEHEEMGKLLFATDTYQLPYRFKNLDHIMIECNYADDILQENMDAGLCPAQLRDRLMTSHMELANCMGVVRENTSENTKDVVLLHLSNDNADGKRFSEGIMRTTGLITYVATPSLEIELTTDNPY